MRINGTGQSSGVTSTTRKKGARSGESFEGALGELETTSSSPLKAAAPALPVGGLLALQETPDATVGRSKGVARAEEMLQQLEDIRRGIVMGIIPAPKLQVLVQTLRQQKTETGDPRLNGLLDEIEMRAAVELAKLGIYL